MKGNTRAALEVVDASKRIKHTPLAFRHFRKAERQAFAPSGLSHALAAAQDSDIPLGPFNPHQR
jgi:hypothetical protein